MEKLLSHTQLAEHFGVETRQLTEMRGRSEKKLGKSIGIPISPNGRDRVYTKVDIADIEAGLRECLNPKSVAIGTTYVAQSRESQYAEAYAQLTQSAPSNSRTRLKKKSGKPALAEEIEKALLLAPPYPST